MQVHSGQGFLTTRHMAFYGMTYYFLYPFQNFFANLGLCSIGIMYLKGKEMLISMSQISEIKSFSDAFFTSKIVAFFAIPKVIDVQSVSTFRSLIESRAKVQIL